MYPAGFLPSHRITDDCDETRPPPCHRNAGCPVEIGQIGIELNVVGFWEGDTAGLDEIFLGITATKWDATSRAKTSRSD